MSSLKTHIKMKTKIILLLILSIFCLQTFAQTKTVTGTAFGVDKNPAYIYNKNKYIGKTDYYGNFAVRVKETDTLTFSSYDCVSKQIVISEKSVINNSLYKINRVRLPEECIIPKIPKKIGFIEDKRSKEIYGKVCNKEGLGIDSVIVFKNNQFVCYTDSLGNYSLQAFWDRDRLILDKIGFQEQQFSVAKDSVFNTILFKATKTVTGTVVGENGRILRGVVVSVNENSKRITDYDGKYSIEVNENDILQFRHPGFIEQKIAVAGKLVINVTLIEKEYKEYVVDIPRPPGGVREKVIPYSVLTIQYTKKQKIFFWFRRLKNKIFPKKLK